MSATIELDKLQVKFGEFTAVRDVSLQIAAGEFFSFLGSSGCGKTTILRTISGFQHPTSGRVLIDGADVGHLEPNKRPTALIFQNLALFPLMKVWENVAFALEVKGVDKKKRRARAEELLDVVALKNVAERQVSELSGGQKQRVVVARALCAEPKVLLLDEPLSALDLKLRQHMRTELRAIQKKVGITFIYITHDQSEAMTMSDRVAVMSQGQIEQIASPKDIYQKPATAFVASFVGENNLIKGKITNKMPGNQYELTNNNGVFHVQSEHQFSQGDEAFLFVRPEHTIIGKKPKDNYWSAKIEHILFEGSEQKLHLIDKDNHRYKCILPLNMSIEDFRIEQELILTADNARMSLLPAGKLA